MTLLCNLAIGNLRSGHLIKSLEMEKIFYSNIKMIQRGEHGWEHGRIYY